MLRFGTPSVLLSPCPPGLENAKNHAKGWAEFWSTINHQPSALRSGLRPQTHGWHELVVAPCRKRGRVSNQNWMLKTKHRYKKIGGWSLTRVPHENITKILHVCMYNYIYMWRWSLTNFDQWKLWTYLILTMEKAWDLKALKWQSNILKPRGFAW